MNNNNNNRKRIEQETTITFNAEEREAIIWTAWPPLLRKFAKWGLQPYRKEPESAFFKVDKKYVTIRNPTLVRKVRKLASGHGFQRKKVAS